MKTTEVYVFSPTGGTKKVAETFAKAMADEVKTIDLVSRDVIALDAEPMKPISDVVVVAAPVFAGRIPSVAREKLKKLQGGGKKAVTLAVYGVRAYEDALLELNDIMSGCGFDVIASGAFIAQHSMVPAVGAGRPDEKDVEEIKTFASKVESKLAAGDVSQPKVPGNRPYKEEMAVANTPISNEGCVSCGACERICPTEAIKLIDGTVETELEKCIDCLACVAACPLKVRTLKPAHQAAIDERLGALVEVYRENEMFI